LNNNKLINEKLICAFRWSVLPSIMKMHGPKNKTCIIYSREVYNPSFTFILILFFEMISLHKLCAVLEPCLLCLRGLSQTSIDTEHTS